MVDGIKHKKVTTLPDNPAYDVSKTEWEEEHNIDENSVPTSKLSGTIESEQIEGTVGTMANTPNTSTWGQAQTARKVVLYDVTTGKPKLDYLQSGDILNPALILTFGHNLGYALVSSTGSEQDTPTYTLTYQGTCSNCSVTASPAMTGYPHSLDSPYTSHVGPALNALTTVGAAYTITASATIDGQEKTKDCYVYYYNKRLWGVSSNDAIDTAGEIDTFQAAQSSEVHPSRAKTFTVTAGAGEYIYYICRSDLGTPSFKVGGFSGGFQLVAGTVSWTNARGKTENYQVWRSTNAALGTTIVEVT